VLIRFDLFSLCTSSSLYLHSCPIIVYWCCCPYRFSHAGHPNLIRTSLDHAGSHPVGAPRHAAFSARCLSAPKPQAAVRYGPMAHCDWHGHNTVVLLLWWWEVVMISFYQLYTYIICIYIYFILIHVTVFVDDMRWCWMIMDHTSYWLLSVCLHWSSIDIWWFSRRRSYSITKLVCHDHNSRACNCLSHRFVTLHLFTDHWSDSW
jgi:hypothetical protein